MHHLCKFSEDRISYYLDTGRAEKTLSRPECRRQRLEYSISPPPPPPPRLRLSELKRNKEFEIYLKGGKNIALDTLMFSLPVF